MTENAVYRAIRPHPGIPNPAKLISGNVKLEKMENTQYVEIEKIFSKKFSAAFIRDLSVLMGDDRGSQHLKGGGTGA